MRSGVKDLGKVGGKDSSNQERPQVWHGEKIKVIGMLQNVFQGKREEMKESLQSILIKLCFSWVEPNSTFQV